MDSAAGLAEATLVDRFYTTVGEDPFDTVEWEIRDAWPGRPQYHNPRIEVPVSWSQNALNITSKLYLARSVAYTEKSIKMLIQRIASKYAVEGARHNYFGNFAVPCQGRNEELDLEGRLQWIESLDENCQVRVFYAELCYVLLHQLAAFNSPVWFNVGRPDRRQQVSACFILSVEDSTESIMKTAWREADIFRGGSGSGFDGSRIRGSMEHLSAGGTSSGLVSFMRLWDAGAGTFKSGGTTRRAAKLVKCDMDHPDIRDFITCKAREEDRMRALIKAGIQIAGFDMENERNLAETTSFQNANHSVGASDSFMRKATGEDDDPTWPLIWRTIDRYEDVDEVGAIINDSAPELMKLIGESAHNCADPGIQFTDTINRMHTTPVINGVPSPIRSSNPCGEYLSNDDTSCNLASINVLKFVAEPGHSTWDPTNETFGRDRFDVAGYRHVVDVMTVAMDISICFGHFPDEKFTTNSRNLRQLGLGYSNMGAAIMAQGLPYDSDEGRSFAAAVTALNTGRCYSQSARLAKHLSPFYHFEENKEAMLGVIRRHIEALPTDEARSTSHDFIWEAAAADWGLAASRGKQDGFRNAQASVLAPAGTISYLMDCDTTGVEPAFELVVYKDLAGGGNMVLVNQSVKRAAEALGGYSEENLKAMAAGDFSSIALKDQATFASANQISPEGHIKMLAAVQPFVSGGISKTINMAEEATPEQIIEAYVTAWRLGVKDLAIYRNNSKARQVHSGTKKEKGKEKDRTSSPVREALESFVAQEVASRAPVKPGPAPGLDEKIASQVQPRNRMRRTRKGIIHKIHVRSAMGEHEGYVTAGMYDDGRLGEIFIEGFGKQGSFTQNALAAWATDFSIALQYGVPMDVLCSKHAWVSDETGGVVVPSDDGSKIVITTCKSIVDYIARWLVAEFGTIDLQEQMGVMTDALKERKAAELDQQIVVGVDWGQKDPAMVVTAVNDGMTTIISTNGHKVSPSTGMTCNSCGGIMNRTGSCYSCPSCGHNTGCG